MIQYIDNGYKKPKDDGEFISMIEHEKVESVIGCVTKETNLFFT